MKKIKIEDIRKLRAKTGAGVADCRQCLEECAGDLVKATEMIRQKGIARAAAKTDRQVPAGRVFSYIHHNGRVGVLVSLACETDFVAKTDDFQSLGRELALHIAASKPSSIEELLNQEYVRDPSQKISDLVKEVIGKLGENIQVIDFKVIGV